MSGCRSRKMGARLHALGQRREPYLMRGLGRDKNAPRRLRRACEGAQQSEEALTSASRLDLGYVRPRARGIKIGVEC